MTVQKQKISIGAIQPIIKGTYNPTLSYKYLNIVSTNDASYICSNRLGAPAGVSITDEQFWHCLARDGQDGAVTFANNKDYANEAADKAISPALIKPILSGMEAKQSAFEKYGIAYDSQHFDSKTVDEVLALAPGRVVAWTKPGTYLWTCPKNVTCILVSGCAGGGGGGGSVTTNYERKTAAGAGGGAGGTVVNYPLTVIPGTTYTITIGAGGEGGTSAPTSGKAGGETSIGIALILGGGKGGQCGNLADGGPTKAGGKAGQSPQEQFAEDGASIPGYIEIASRYGGKGGSSFWGKGGIWKSHVSYPGTGNGSGGSGGFSTTAYKAGAAGSPGMMVIQY